jgi:hypothetical protein
MTMQKTAKRRKGETYANMIILPTGGQPIRMTGEPVFVAYIRSRAFERQRLEVTSRNRFGVVPSNLECSKTHRIDEETGCESEFSRSDDGG